MQSTITDIIKEKIELPDTIKKLVPVGVMIEQPTLQKLDQVQLNIGVMREQPGPLQKLD